MVQITQYLYKLTPKIKTKKYLIVRRQMSKCQKRARFKMNILPSTDVILIGLFLFQVIFVNSITINTSQI